MSIPKEFLRTEKIRAVCSIRNLKNDRIYLYTSDDAVKSYAGERFKLDLGIHSSKELQEEYTKLGLELFVIGIYEEADEKEDLALLLEECRSRCKKEGKNLYD